MQNYYNNPNPIWNQSEVQQWTPKETLEAIQNISKNIRTYSFRVRETMKTLRDAGAIPEVALAIREGSFALRDTVTDLNETTQELKRNGVVNDTATAVEKILENAGESITNVREIAVDAGKVLPNTSKALKDGIGIIKKEAIQVSGSFRGLKK